MSLLHRLFGPPKDETERLRPLWHRVVEIAREPEWYTRGGIADTMAGRFDAITLILALVLLRMERVEELRLKTGRLTELFLADMDGQLRQSGVGDVVMHKRMGELMGVLGGRIDALRGALAQADDAALLAAIDRNVTMIEGTSPQAIAERLREFAGQLSGIDDAALLAGKIVR